MKKKKKKNRLSTILLIAILLIGLSLLLYPTFSDYWNSFHQTRAIMHYMESVGSMDTAEYDAILASARAYNESINTGEFRWFLTDEEQEVYNAELNFSNNGSMGFITIEKIHVQLPIYHGTSEAVLQTSIGHIEWTSLPVGGEGTHCVLSGHRGLPSAKLFSELDKLTEGDVFQLSILNETLTYQVDQIRVVEPTDLTELQIEDGKDYCTLVTCTPYAINSHRLLVRGHRVDNPQGDAKVVADAMQIETMYVIPFVGIPILLLLLVLLIIRTSGRNRRRESYAQLMDWERELERETQQERRAAKADKKPDPPDSGGEKDTDKDISREEEQP